MRAIAESLVLAMAYLACRPSIDAHALEEDSRAVAEVIAFLRDASEQEQQALADAAKRWLEREKVRAEPDHRFLEIFGRFMEDMFGGAWVGNDRPPQGV